MDSRKKIEAIAITAILVLSVFAVFVTSADNLAVAPGPAVGTNVTINETAGRSILQPSTGVNFTIQFNTTNQTDIANTTWFINITLVSGSSVNISGPSPNVTVTDSLNATLTDYNTTFWINGTGDAQFDVKVENENNSAENATLTGFIFDGTEPSVTIDTPTESVPVYRKGGELFYVNFTYTESNPANYTVEIRNSTAVINSTTNSSVVGGENLFANESFNLNLTAADGRYNVTVKMYDNVSLSYIAYQNYSVIKDDTPPVISQPPDKSIRRYEIAYITWHVTDANADKYWVLRNEAQVVAPTNYISDGVDISVQIDTMSLGVWNYTIVVNDTAQNEIADIVNVTVFAAVPEFNTTGLIAFIGIMSVVLAVVTLRRKR